MALLKLATPLRLSATIATVCLPKQGQRVSLDAKCFITGWFCPAVFMFLSLPITVDLLILNFDSESLIGLKYNVYPCAA